MKKIKYLKAGLIAVFLVLTGIIYSCQRGGNEQPDSALGTPLTAEETKQEDTLADLPKDTNIKEDTDIKEDKVTAAKKEEKYFVHICGAVKKPGVYEVSQETRIFEVVSIAGGFTKEADEDYINQAVSIEDGQQIYIPTKAEVKKEKAGESGNMKKVSGKLSQASGRLGQAQNDAGSTDKININSATKEELCTLPGIGEAKAGSIIEYRTSHGGFQSIEELKEIDGIKDAVFNKIKDSIVSK
ncbi:helix-hairpin-helix domain-containing protein [Anaerocolumna jejuensis]|uniref:helix-hairpin-helix domain-containing protein n=1 Tax=Anaerocolumna jejuensis TaxID=259063 RepID=UPI003F7C8E1E